MCGFVGCRWLRHWLICCWSLVMVWPKGDCKISLYICDTVSQLQFDSRCAAGLWAILSNTHAPPVHLLLTSLIHLLSQVLIRAFTYFLPARRYASAGNSDRNVSGCLSVCPSVTRRYCVKTKKASGMISSPSGSPKTLVSDAKFHHQILRGSPERGPQTSVGRKNSAIF